MHVQSRSQPIRLLRAHRGESPAAITTSLAAPRDVHHRLLALVTVALLTGACASAGRHAQQSADAGDWDTAVEYYQRAVQEDPDRAEYEIGLQRAMLNASRAHLAAGRAFEQQQELSAALQEYRAASGFDPSNTEIGARAASLERTIRDQIEAARPPAAIAAMREQARRETEPPLLNPASRDPLVLDFRGFLSDLIDFIGDVTGINVTYDEQFQDREVTIRIDGLTLEETLHHVLSTNQSFYKVLTRISDLAMVLYRQDQSPRLDFWGSDVRSHTT